MTQFSTQDWCQLYRLLDRMPEDGLVQSDRNCVASLWGIVRGRLMEADLDPDDVVQSEQTPGEAWEMLSGWIERELDPLGGQEGTAELWEAKEAVERQLKAASGETLAQIVEAWLSLHDAQDSLSQQFPRLGELLLKAAGK